MRFIKELKVGSIAISGIILLVLGVNFLKGNSFFGGDLEYYSYFENSGQLTVASNVTLNGVVVGKVKKIAYTPNINPKKRVKVTFTINNSDVVLPKGTIIEIGSEYQEIFEEFGGEHVHLVKSSNDNPLFTEGLVSLLKERI